MNKPVARYDIPEEVVFLLERFHFTLTGLNALILQFTYQSDFPIDRDRYDQLLGEYLEAYTEKELAFQQVLHATVAPEFLLDAYYTQEVNFITKEVLVYEKGDGHGSCTICVH